VKYLRFFLSNGLSVKVDKAITNPKSIQRNYLILTLFNTLAGSFIWGINTLLLLDAGLNKTQAFGANAFFTFGMVLFDVPTGVIADSFGRRVSYLLGCTTLIVTTFIYYILWTHHSPFWSWALDSIFLGLGFTFFSGATDAWLVDALNFSKFNGSLENVFAKAQVVSGFAMFIGATLGGVVAQYTNLGIPYLIRCIFLFVSLCVATFIMFDLGFTPRKTKSLGDKFKNVINVSIDGGLRIPAVRWVMLISPIMSGVGIYGFYAAQPHLLELFGNSKNYSIAGIAASLVALSQIAGGALVPFVKKYFNKRTSLFAVVIIGSAALLCFFGLVKNFWLAIFVLGLWGLLSAIMTPQKQSYLNKCIKSDGRATVLSFDSTLGSIGGVVIQPMLGKTADVWSFGISFIFGGLIQLIALPLVWLARREKSIADEI
jgi:MFS family permease